MKMRMKPRRGMKLVVNGQEITLLDRRLDRVEVILPSGKTGVVDIDELNLPVIDTKEYEKI